MALFEVCMILWFIYFIAIIFSSVCYSASIDAGFGLFYSEKRIHRGALIWDSPILALSPNITLFDVFTIGPFGAGFNLSNKHSPHKFFIGFNQFNDRPNGPIIKLKPIPDDYKTQRGLTYETSFRYDYWLDRWLNFSLAYHKDIKLHRGNYGNTGLSIRFYFLTIGTLIGIGDRRHNQFIYGPEGETGVAHRDSFASLALPILPWKGVLITSFTYSTIPNDANAYADYIRGQGNNTNISVGGELEVLRRRIRLSLKTAFKHKMNSICDPLFLIIAI